MKWQIYNYPTKTLIPVDFQAFDEAFKLTDRRYQTVVSIAETDEDLQYGLGMDCAHGLHPEECLFCNPELADAVQAKCPTCDAVTWHLPYTPERACRDIAKGDESSFLSPRGLARRALKGTEHKCVKCGYVHDGSTYDEELRRRKAGLGGTDANMDVPANWLPGRD